MGYASVAVNEQDKMRDKEGPSVSSGSSILGTVFNFTNSMVGAGAIGTGGAIAKSGGVVSIVSILCMAFLTKLSLDLVISLSVETEGAQNSYEQLGYIASGGRWWGRQAVSTSKFLFSFGCLVAYVLLCKNNLGSALRHLLWGDAAIEANDGLFQSLLLDDVMLTWFMSTIVILPLCLLRDMTPLGAFSAVKVTAFYIIVLIVIYMFFSTTTQSSEETIIPQHHDHYYNHWFQVRPGLVSSLGTFVFTFVTQHTCNLTYDSIRPDLRTLQTWKQVTTLSILITCVIVLSAGVFSYITFWEETNSDLFTMYPSSHLVDVGKMLLCGAMLLTYPMPFFTCRELLILCLPRYTSPHPYNDMEEAQPVHDIIDPERRPLTQCDAHKAGKNHPQDIIPSPIITKRADPSPRRWTMPGQDTQLRLPYHVTLTLLLWSFTTHLAITASSFGAVLDLIGCATGTLIAFVLPGLFSFHLRGYTHSAALILLVGGAVGIVGTYCSLRTLLLGV